VVTESLHPDEEKKRMYISPYYRKYEGAHENMQCNNIDVMEVRKEPLSLVCPWYFRLIQLDFWKKDSSHSS